MKIGKILLLALLLAVIIASGCSNDSSETEERIVTVIGQERTMSEIKGMMSPPLIDKNAYRTRIVEFLGFSYVFGNITKVERLSEESNYGLITFADGEQIFLRTSSGWFSKHDSEWQENRIHRITIKDCYIRSSKCIYGIVTINEG